MPEPADGLNHRRFDLDQPTATEPAPLPLFCHCKCGCPMFLIPSEQSKRECIYCSKDEHPKS